MSDPASDEIKLNDLVFKVLDHAMDSIRDGNTPLVPFSIVENVAGEKILTRYAVERLEEGLSMAQMRMEEEKSNILRYAFAWDGFITLEGKKWEAILVEAGDKVAESGILLCQRYQKTGLFREKNEAVGNPVLVGKPASRVK